MERFEALREKTEPVLLPQGVKAVPVLGSVARGEDMTGSDIDVLVILKPTDERPPVGVRWSGLEEELTRVLGREVELVSESALSPSIRPYVEEGLVVLYEEG